MLTGSAEKIKWLFLSLTCPESHLLTYPFHKTEYGKSSPRETKSVQKEYRHPVLLKSTSPAGAVPRARQPWHPVQLEGDTVGLSRAALPQQGSGCSFPVPSGCGRWAQPWADTGTEPSREEPLWGPSLPHALVLLLVCTWEQGLQQRCSDNSQCPCAWEQEPPVSATSQGMGVTSEASDGQSAMEMVILYWVSLEWRGTALVRRFPLLWSPWNFSSHTASQPCRVCCPFRTVRTDGSQREGSLHLHSSQVRLRYSLARFFAGVNADLTLFYAGPQ